MGSLCCVHSRRGGDCARAVPSDSGMAPACQGSHGCGGGESAGLERHLHGASFGGPDGQEIQVPPGKRRGSGSSGLCGGAAWHFQG